MENTTAAASPIDIPVRPQRWTGLVQAHEKGEFVSVGDYIDAMDQIDAAVAAERSKWRAACENIARDLRNHDMVRLGASKCLDAGLMPIAMVSHRPGAWAAKAIERRGLAC